MSETSRSAVIMRREESFERKASLLADVVRRIAKDGWHTAVPHADRARQFMPFAALKGHDVMIKGKERLRAERQEVTEERARDLSLTMSMLRRGDTVCVIHYEDDECIELCGAVSEVLEAHRAIRVGEKVIAFGDILEIDIEGRAE